MPAELSRALDRLEAALAACATDPPDLEAVSLVADAVEALLRVLAATPEALAEIGVVAARDRLELRLQQLREGIDRMGRP